MGNHKLFLLCRHPDTWLPCKELIDGLVRCPDVGRVCVYSIQQAPPRHPREVAPHKKVRYMNTVNNTRVDTEAIKAELAANIYDAVLIMHTINVVAAACAALKPVFRKCRRVIAFCEMPRDGNSSRIYELMRATKEELGNVLEVACSSDSNRDILEKKMGCGVRVVRPYIDTSAYSEMRPAPLPAGPEAEFRVLAVGRLDIALMAFVAFLLNIGTDRKVRLLMSVDEGVAAVKGCADEILDNELSRLVSSGVDARAVLSKITLVRDVSSMDHTDLRRLYGSAHVVLHSNLVTDFNQYVRQLLLARHPQIVPDVPACTEATPRDAMSLVQPNFTFYNMDGFGGRLTMASHTDLAHALLSVYYEYPVLRQRAEEHGLLFGQLAGAYSMDTWCDLLGLTRSAPQATAAAPPAAPVAAAGGCGAGPHPTSPPTQGTCLPPHMACPRPCIEGEIKSLQDKLNSLLDILGTSVGVPPSLCKPPGKARGAPDWQAGGPCEWPAASHHPHHHPGQYQPVGARMGCM